MQTKMTWKVRVLSLVLICLALLALSLLTDISTNTRSSAVCGQANGSRMQDQAARADEGGHEYDNEGKQAQRPAHDRFSAGASPEPGGGHPRTLRGANPLFVTNRL